MSHKLFITNIDNVNKENKMLSIIEDALQKIEELLKQERIEEAKKEEPSFKYPTEEDVLLRIMKKQKLEDIEAAKEWLQNIWKYYPGAVLSILAKEVAIILDKQYPDHIRNTKEVYFIGLNDGQIHQMPKIKVKNYNAFAIFRTLGDALWAFNFLKRPLNSLFNEQ